MENERNQVISALNIDFEKTTKQDFKQNFENIVIVDETKFPSKQ